MWYEWTKIEMHDGFGGENWKKKNTILGRPELIWEKK
jgi:hypothetical protein